MKLKSLLTIVSCSAIAFSIGVPSIADTVKDSQAGQVKILTAKDINSIIISTLALLVSIYATINTEIKTRSEKKRTIRLQLTDILGRITKLNLDNAKYIKDYAKTDPQYVSNVSSILNQENTSLLWQAKSLSQEIPDLISPVDLNTIAVANYNSGNFIEADLFHRQGIKKADDINDNYSKVLATRSYANFLFSIGKNEDGRDKYKTAISLMQSLPTQGQNDLIPYTNGITYQMWAINELSIGNNDQARKNFSNAQKEFYKIENSFVKDTSLKTLNHLKDNSTANGQQTTLDA